MYDIFSYIRYFHWQSVLDVLLVAYLFYQCSLWVRGSRAILAAVGLAVIGGIALLARWSGLILAGWLFQSLWAVLWLILIIVFQPELRHILERLSLLGLIRGRRSTLHRETLAEITDAVFDLAREHIGALIVLPQRDPLDLYLRGGIYEYSRGFNWRAVIALALGAGTALVGLVVPALRVLYGYSWFVGFAVSFVAYYIFMKFQEQGIRQDHTLTPGTSRTRR